MKNNYSKKIIAVLMLLAAAGSFNSLRAQKLVFLFGHLVYSAPLGSDFSAAYSYGIGGEAGIGVGLLGKTFFTGTVGATDFVHASGSVIGNLHYIPVKAGVRHYVFAKMIFIHGDLGAGFITEKKIDYTATKFTGDLGVGVKFAVFELQADYDGFVGDNQNPGGSWFALKAGFSFGL